MYKKVIIASILFLTLHNLHVQAQSKVFTFDVVNKSLKEVLDYIESNSEYHFFYNSSLINARQKISISVNRQSIREVMKIVAKKCQLEYQIQSTQIILFQKDEGNTVKKKLICGVVKSDSGEKLPGVNIIQKNTHNGTITDSNGGFCIYVKNGSSTLSFSFVGYQNKSIDIGNQSFFDVSLSPTPQYLQEVIVTAIGLKRNKEMLGFATAEIKGKELETYTSENIAGLLKGKISGVNITQVDAGQNASHRIVFRGENSFRDANQPLIVVDGIPVDNSNLYQPTKWGGYDTGDGLSDILLFDIESISILKGANAAALYGTRAANGVIVFTTKRGKKINGFKLNYRAGITLSQPIIHLDFQNTYGRGSGGKILTGFDGVPYIPPTSTESWGAKMEGQEVRIWNGEMRTFLPEENNYTDFWQNGFNHSNNISVAANTTTSYIRSSFAYTRGSDIIPNSNYNKYAVSISGGQQLTSRMRMDTKVNYFRSEVFNRPNMAYHPDNLMHIFVFMPRSIKLDNLKNYITDEGYPVVWDLTPKTRNQNPYWTVYKNTNNDSKNRIIAFISTEYLISKNIKATLNIGTDYYTFRREERTATHTVFERTSPNGDKYLLSNHDNFDFNTDLMLTADTKIEENISLSFLFGANAYHTRYEQIGYLANGLNIPNFFSVNNAENLNPVYNYRQKKLHSVYAATQFSFKSYWFVDATMRNDWSSTLPANNRSFFYPSINTSFIITELLNHEKNMVNFAKLRASFARVGNDTDPYQLSTGYRIYQGHLGQAYGMIYPGTAPFSDLKPEISLSSEAGIETILLKNKLTLDFTVYSMRTKNQVLNIPVSRTSGFSSKLINAGCISNKGVEFAVSVAPVKTNKLDWTISANYSKNKSEVVKLTESITHWGLGDDKGISVSATVGRPFGDLRGRAYKRNSNGDIIIDKESGLPLISDGDTILGNFNPDWRGGISSRLKYKNLSFAAFVEVRMGGEIYSLTNVYAHQNGNATSTLEGRDAWYKSEAERKENGTAPHNWFPTGGILADGVVNTGTDEEPVWEKNMQYIDPAKYWAWLCGGGNNSIAEAFIYDASFIKLNEIIVNYTLPVKLLKKLPLKTVKLSFSGRNLFYIMKSTPNISPEATYNSNNVQGIENCSFPSSRKFVFTLNAEF